MVWTTRFERATPAIRERYSNQTELRPDDAYAWEVHMVGVVRIELTTLPPQTECATAALHSDDVDLLAQNAATGGPSEARTRDL